MKLDKLLVVSYPKLTFSIMRKNNLTSLIELKVLAQKNEVQFYKWLRQKAYLSRLDLVTCARTINLNLIPIL